MSQIATGYGVSTALLKQLSPLLRKHDYEKFWTLLNGQGVQTAPAYSYSGVVVSIAIDCLEDRGVTVPMNTEEPACVAILDSDLEPVLCCDAAEAAGMLKEMRQLEWEAGQLAAYFAEYTGEAWDEAEAAMREGLDYIQRTLSLAPAHAEWVLLIIG